MKEKELVKIDYNYYYPEDCNEGGYGSIVIDPENPSTWAIVKGWEYDNIEDYYITAMIELLGPGPYDISDLVSDEVEELLSEIYSDDVHTLHCRITANATWIKLSEIKQDNIISTSLPEGLKVTGVSDLTILIKLAEINEGDEVKEKRKKKEEAKDKKVADDGFKYCPDCGDVMSKVCMCKL